MSRDPIGHSPYGTATANPYALTTAPWPVTRVPLTDTGIGGMVQAMTSVSPAVPIATAAHAPIAVRIGTTPTVGGDPARLAPPSATSK
jgi:hypothetical protein